MSRLRASRVKPKSGLIANLKRVRGKEKEEKLPTAERKAVAKIRQALETPVTFLTVNDRQVSAFVDTGSVATLMKVDVIKTLGLEGQVKDCNRRLQTVSNQPLKVLGQVMARVVVSKTITLEHSFIVVPNCYLATDMLMGADLIGRAKFIWDGQEQTLCWGGQYYKIQNVQGQSVSKVRWKRRVTWPKESELQVDRSWIHVNEDVILAPGQVTTVRISKREFEPGQIVHVEKYKTRKVSKRSLFTPHDCCFVVDKEKGFDFPMLNPTRSSLRLKPGRRLGRYSVIEEERITYLDMGGRNLGGRTEILKKLLPEITSEGRPVKLCTVHKSLVTESKRPVQETPMIHCSVCCYSTGASANPVGAVHNIDNALLPHSDQAPTTVDRLTRLSTIVDQLNWNHLTKGQQDKLKKVVLTNNQLFILDDKELGQLNVLEAHIETVDPDPVRMPLYRHPEQSKKIIADMINDMLAKGIIEESTAAYLSPIVLVGKPDGSKRLCIDYRGVNKKVKMDIQPLPRLDELVEDSAGKKFYCTLDMKDAYFQVTLDEPSKDITTFSDGLGLYRFKRLPFGLSVSPAIFTRKMQQVLNPLIKQGWCKNYLDNVVIWADSFERLISRLQDTFARLERMGMKLHVSKCAFGMKEIKFLGHIVSERGIRPDKKNIEAVRNMPQPKSVKQVRRFIGMCNFYRKHIENFALLASPLTSLMRKDVPFEWTNECEEAFLTLKEKLVTAPVLVKADQSKAFELHTDASDTHIGGALMQVEGGKDLRPIGYYSKKLNATERKYSVTDKEALAIVNSCRFFNHYLWCKPFTIVTDHQPLTTVFKKRTHCPRMSRYILEMRDYIYKIQYKKGAKYTVPDTLSRPAQ